MNDFFVDPAGLNGLHNQFVRAGGDAQDTLEYTRKYCDLSFPDQGFLFHFVGPHAAAYGQMTDALRRLGEISQSAGEEIEKAQLGYQRSDLASAERLDSAYPGAEDAAGLRADLNQPRPDLRLSRSLFADVGEPTRHLGVPEHVTGAEPYQIDPMTDLLSPTAWLRETSVKLFGHDPFEHWGTSFTGDWSAFQWCAAAWSRIGSAAADTGRNLVAGAADVSSVWRGNAAEAEQEFQLALGNAVMDLGPIANEYFRLYMDAAQSVQELHAVATDLISTLIDKLIMVSISAAAGTATIETVIGPVVGYSVAAYYGWQAFELYNKISAYYSKTQLAINGIAAAIHTVQAGAGRGGATPALTPYQHPSIHDRGAPMVNHPNSSDVVSDGGPPCSPESSRRSPH